MALIEQHTHCWICGKVTPVTGDKSCSDKCRGEYEDQGKKRRTMMWLVYGAMGFAVLMILLQAFQAR
ncbi:MAG: DUF2116 family Zn-ribbon domain-containing protein [Methanobacteriota archaeon]